MSYFNTIDFSDKSISEGLTFLLEYIETRILSRGHLLVETNNMIKNDFSDLMDYKEIGYINPETMKSNKLHIQAELFKKLFEMEQTFNNRNYVTDLIAENQNLEQRFKKIFDKQTWPINLTI